MSVFYVQANTEELQSAYIDFDEKETKTRGGPRRSCGFDLIMPEKIELPPRVTVMVDMKVRVKHFLNGRPHGFMVASRSSTFIMSILVGNGVVDPYYNKNLMVYFTNAGMSNVILLEGHRYAQLVLPSMDVPQIEYDKPPKVELVIPRAPQIYIDVAQDVLNKTMKRLAEKSCCAILSSMCETLKAVTDHTKNQADEMLNEMKSMTLMESSKTSCT